MLYTNWKIKSQPIALVNKLASELECNDIVSRLLINRGFTDINMAKKFLYPNDDVVHDPYLLNDMDCAVKRILKAIENNEKICIYGDYDVDGITSVSVLYLYLKHFTDNLIYFIPDRFNQGYGIHNLALERIADLGCSLIITVDTGISAVKEIDYAKSLGIDIVITDHHECQAEIPAAFSVVNPKRHDSTYPFAKLAGVGVVYKLISAIDYATGSDFKDDNLDLIAIGTIADIMPLLDENRYIVKRGLERISTSSNKGLKALLHVALNSSTITASSIGYAIAPRINAAGRMDKAELAVKLFVTNDPIEADSIANKLCDLNVERQKIENTIFEEASQIISDYNLDKKFNALVLWKENWHNGVIGIVASKLKEKYNKPVVLFSVDKNSKGSGRSVAPFNLYDAFEKCSDIILQYGGHKYAAGVLIDNSKLHEFRNRLSDLVGEYTKDNELSADIDVECELSHNFVSYKTAESITMLQPFGKSNVAPLFCVRNVIISEIFPTSNNKHLRIKFMIGNKSITGFYFGKSLTEFDYRENDLVDIVCEVNVNEYRSSKSLQLIVHDLRLGENSLASNAAKRKRCEELECNHSLLLPTRNDISYTYKFLLNSFRNGKKIFNIDTLPNLINKDCLCNLNYEQAYYSLKVLMELGVVCANIEGISLNVSSIVNDKKFSLCDSEILMRIYNKVGVKFGN